MAPVTPLTRSLTKLENLLYWADELAFAGAKEHAEAARIERNYERAKAAMIADLARLHSATKPEGP